MADNVKGRPYTSTLRAEQANTTRSRIAQAAVRLFATNGYSQTSIEQIAAGAGVARPTVYKAFAGKSALLKAAVDVALAGDDLPIPVAERPWAEEVLRQRNPRILLELQARNDRMINERVAGLYEAVRNAAAINNEIADLYVTLRQQRLAGARITIDALAALTPLRDGLDLDSATDVLWMLKDPALWTALVADRGWPAERYQDWLAGTMQDSLLPSPANRHRPLRGP